MDIAYGMTPQSYRSYNNWHWIIGIILALLLLLLPWLTNGRIGPHGWLNCAPAAAAPAAVVAPPVVAPAPAPVAVAPVSPVSPPKPAVAAPIPKARVYFALDKFALPGDVDKTLAEVIAYLKSHPGASGVISGFHDPQGQVTQQYQDDLSKNRALAVSGALARAGISADRLVMAKPTDTMGTGSNDEARRVEVTIQP